MELTFLGTGTSQGVPVIACKCNVCQSLDAKDKRLRTSIMLSVDGMNIVIDTGPDFRQQMLREKVEKVDAIVFTHEHKDHTAGFDDIRAYNYIMQKKMNVYATERVWEALKREFAYVFSDFKYPGIPEINQFTIDINPFKIMGVQFIPILTYHLKLPVFSFRIKNFTYITDANYIPDEELEKIKGSEVIVINALRKEKHISHFNLEEALDIINKINPKKAYLIHMSHQMGTHEDVSLELPENVFLSYDGLKVQVN
jgi:phosphoribosyl 1,2-cyclic phosphate phosphodiesterase